MTNPGDRRGRERKPASPRAAVGKQAARGKQPGRGRKDPPALPRLGPDDEWPYARARQGARRPQPAPDARGPRKSDGRTSGGDGARGGARGRTRDAQRPAGSARGGRAAPDDREARRRQGQVTGPFTRRKPAEKPAEPKRASLRIKSSTGRSADRAAGSMPAPARKKATARKASGRARNSAAAAPRPPGARRKRGKPTEATEELRRLAGGNAKRAVDTLARASDAFAQGHERDALRMLKPLTDAYPRAAAVRELAGLCRYRLGTYNVAADDLAAFVELTGSTEQHPVLMDCRRAQGKLRDVEALWEELRESSPSAALVTEGRIVYAGALADSGRLGEAIDLLARRSGGSSGRTQEHTVRLWYALADLYDRSGDVPRARALFDQVRNFDAEFADVAERLAALS